MGAVDDFDSSIYLRDDVSEENSMGGRPEKNATATLRVVGSNLGVQWLMYGGVGGGTQDYERPEGEAVRCEWFTVYYRGILLVEGKKTFGQWDMHVRGTNLESHCHHVGKQTLSILRVGKTVNSTQPVVVSSITFSPSNIHGQDDEA